MSSKNVGHLVVDTNAFFNSLSLQDVANNIYTVQEVIDEITCKKQLRKLFMTPYELIVKDVFPENIKFISEFAKKTGDYSSLSATDIKVVALTYQLEKEITGTVQHLKTQPETQKTVKVSGTRSKLENFVCDNKNCDPNTNETNTESCIDICSVDKVNHAHDSFDDDNCDENTSYDQSVGQVLSSDVMQKFEDIQIVKNLNEPDILVKICDDSDTDDDAGEWITPGNVKNIKEEMKYGDCFENKSVNVACITTDFAMQNVLKQIGLNVLSIDGKIIRQLRTFIFRCTTCFKTTSIMTKVFCPKCGHATLKKVAVSVDEDGNQQIYINGKKPLTARGKRFSLPTPRGGQHFQYPVLTEDQHIRKKQVTLLARKKNNPLGPDYLAGYSPFVVRDVNSKSAILGIRNDKQTLKYLSMSNNKKK